MSTTELIKFHDSQLNSDEENSLSDDYDTMTSTSASTEIVQDNNSSDEGIFEQDDDLDDYYYAQFSWPDGSDDDLEYFYTDSNDDLYMNNHLNRKQLILVDHLEKSNFQRAKQSHKKMNAQRQIKTKYAKSIKIKSHNKQLYMHHRLVKKVQLDPPSSHYMPSVRTQSSQVIQTVAYENKHPQPVAKNHNQKQQSVVQNNQFQNYTLHQQNISNEPSFDDAMIAFLLDMQNRDLSPNDYEMLLRLDERVQRKTVDRNILHNLPTVLVNETHLKDQCIICMETYTLGQQLKLLPCTHMFHSACIETYLKDFSTQCPLDNLPIT